ncbi:MAG TPA: hypothetical protein VFV02_03980 [Acidimicrobiales bacterium]|nr:hypothetical protein [Acidimicrobiales bacterium]
MIIEILRFRLSRTAEEAAFLEADKRVQTEFAYQQPGLLRRTTAKGADGIWGVVDLWRSAADADRCDGLWGQQPVTDDFRKFMDPNSVTTERFETLD